MTGRAKSGFQTVLRRAVTLSLTLAILPVHPFGISAITGAISSVGVSMNASLTVLSGMHGEARACPQCEGA